MPQETFTLGRYRIHTLMFALAATLLVAGLTALTAAVKDPGSLRLSELPESPFVLGGVLFFLGAWVAPQAVDETP